MYTRGYVYKRLCALVTEFQGEPVLVSGIKPELHSITLIFSIQCLFFLTASEPHILQHLHLLLTSPLH